MTARLQTQRWWSCALWVGVGFGLLVAAWADGPPAGGSNGPPAMNRLSGVVVDAEGKPAAGVSVAMAHVGKGNIRISKKGVSGSGPDERVLRFFLVPNSSHFCRATTDAEGRFSLLNFAGPNEPWALAAGSDEYGYAVLPDLRPGQHADSPVKVELRPAAWVVLTPPKPPAGGMSLNVSAKVVIDPGDEEEPCVQLEIPELKTRGTTRLGPFPARVPCRLGVFTTGRKLPYWAKLAAREVTLEPGAAQEMKFDAPAGATVSGRVVGTDDKPLADVNITIKADDGFTLGAVTDAEGKYEIRGLPEGTHTLKLLRHAKRLAPG